MTSHYILVAADTESVSGEIIPATMVALARLGRRSWGVYRRTQNRLRIRERDRMLIYAAGASERGGRRFLAAATIESISAVNSLTTSSEVDLLTDIPVAVIKFSGVELFPNPVSVYEVREELGFIPSHNRWGAVFQGGCRAISQADFDCVLNKARLSFAAT